MKTAAQYLDSQQAHTSLEPLPAKEIDMKTTAQQTHRQQRPRSRASGFTMIELLITAAVISVFAMMVVPRATGVFSDNNLVVAQAEIEGVIRAVQKWRASPAHSNYTGITITALSTGGYGVAPLTSGVGENVYNLDITVVPITSGAAAFLTYDTGTNQACQNLADNLVLRQGTSDWACGNGVVSLGID